jgi:hypothetical protein
MPLLFWILVLHCVIIYHLLSPAAEYLELSVHPL